MWWISAQGIYSKKIIAIINKEKEQWKALQGYLIELQWGPFKSF